MNLPKTGLTYRGRVFIVYWQYKNKIPMPTIKRTYAQLTKATVIIVLAADSIPFSYQFALVLPWF